jgi:hypothetical protein
LKTTSKTPQKENGRILDKEKKTEHKNQILRHFTEAKKH